MAECFCSILLWPTLLIYTANGKTLHSSTGCVVSKAQQELRIEASGKGYSLQQGVCPNSPATCHAHQAELVWLNSPGQHQDVQMHIMADNNKKIIGAGHTMKEARLMPNDFHGKVELVIRTGRDCTKSNQP